MVSFHKVLVTVYMIIIVIYLCFQQKMRVPQRDTRICSIIIVIAYQPS